MAAHKPSQTAWRARKDDRPPEMPPATGTQMARMELPEQTVVSPRTNHKRLGTIPDPRSVAPEILRTREKTEIAASSRMAAGTMENKFLPGAGRMGRAGRERLRLETMDNEAIAAATNNRRTTIHKDNAEGQNSNKTHRTAARNRLRRVGVRAALIGCGN